LEPADRALHRSSKASLNSSRFLAQIPKAAVAPLSAAADQSSSWSLDLSFWRILMKEHTKRVEERLPLFGCVPVPLRKVVPVKKYLVALENNSFKAKTPSEARSSAGLWIWRRSENETTQNHTPETLRRHAAGFPRGGLAVAHVQRLHLSKKVDPKHGKAKSKASCHFLAPDPARQSVELTADSGPPTKLGNVQTAQKENGRCYVSSNMIESFAQDAKLSLLLFKVFMLAVLFSFEARLLIFCMCVCG